MKVLDNSRPLIGGRGLASTLLVEFYLVAIAAVTLDMWTGGPLVRYTGFPILRLAAGVHDYAILMTLAIGVLAFVAFRGSALLGLFFPIAAYSLHEALFNVFFLSFNQRIPVFAFDLWWIEFALEAGVTAVAIGVGLFRPSKVSLALLVSLVGLTLIWIGLGFPVTTNIFDTPSQNALNNVSVLANAFEVAWNAVSLTFIALLYRWKW